MKKFIITLLMLMLCVSTALFTISCDKATKPSTNKGESSLDTESVIESESTAESETESEIVNDQSFIEFKTLTVDGLTVYGKVSNETTTFSFINEICTDKNCKYEVSLDIYGVQLVMSKTIALNVGDNVVYVIEFKNDEPMNLYTVTIRRRPLYRVTFNTDGGSAVATQNVEEDFLATEPTTEKVGYDFVSWNYNFNEPITRDMAIVASWSAHTDTPYRVEYYLQGANGVYELDHTDSLQGETDVTATAQIKTYEHYTYSAEESEISGVIHGDGSLVLKVYYTLNVYEIKTLINNSGAGILTGSGIYDYGKQITLTATTYLGYTFDGWYDGDTLVSKDAQFTFIVDKHVGLVAIFKVKPEMENFNFTSTTNICVITGTKSKTVTKVVIPDYVTSVGDWAFYDCRSLTNITIPNSTTSIGDSAFYDCRSLTNVTIPNSTTSIGDSAFNNCRSLNSVEIGDSVTLIGDWAFYDCRSLTSIVIEGNVISIGDYAFSKCISLASVTIGDSVTSIGDYAFSYCERLTNINVSENNTAYKSMDGDLYTKDGKTLIQYAIGKTATSFAIPDIVNLIGDRAFSDCISLTSIVIDGNVISIGDSAFSKCISLVSVTIGDSVISIGDGVFESCSGLMTVVIGGRVTSIGAGAFICCGRLTNVEIPDSVTSIDYHAFYECSSLTSVVIGDGATSIGEGAFYGCSNLTSVVIGDSVTSIASSAFYYCRSLTSIVIGGNVTSIASFAFYDCNCLTSIYFKGSASDWVNISIGINGNDGLTSAMRYYYSEIDPTASGNYWHYDENGEIAVWSEE